MPVNVTAKLSLPKFGTKQVGKKPAAKKPAVRKSSPVSKKSGTITNQVRAGGAGYRKFSGEALWLPNTERPAWLDGSLPGDRGFDPLGLAKPTEYLQVDVDELDQNAAQNKPGDVVGEFSQRAEKVSATESLQPYDEVFGLDRFRECELIHGRWAMLATLGCIVAESATGVSWVEAGKVELDGAKYFGFDLPFSITQIAWFEALAVGGAEIYRNTELDTTKRCYPGGIFDPLNLAEGEKGEKLKEAEIKHARLAMVSFLGYGVQAISFNEGALGSLALFAKNLNGN
eukprot:GFKZ01013012.1.p1 GENE.GFKZ01013012.1~~GFKZ01013012.1.p1  ORF type:complete len:286 (+),score=44.62 GFKZ01013012.1:69-926(+)